MSRSIQLLENLTSGLNKDVPTAEKKRVADGFFLICLTNFFTKIGDLLASPKITLTWLMQSMGAPAFAISLIVPIRESGSMLPQLLLARLVSSKDKKVRLYQAGAVVQALAIAGIAMSALVITGMKAGGIVVSLLVLFSLGRCMCSLVSKAVLGDVIPKSLRGQTTGWSATTAGLTSCAVAVYLLMQGASQSIETVVVMLLLASACWLLATIAYGFINESSVTSQTNDAVDQSILQKLKILETDSDFRKFIIVRTLFISSALVTPYYILLGGKANSTIQVLGGLLLASGLAKLCSSVVWGRWSDRSSRQALIASGLLVSGIGLITTAIHWVQPTLLGSMWLIPMLYFGLEIAHQGVRVARKTYVVDLATNDVRVDFVAISNSIIGVLLLVFGFFLGIMSTLFEPIWLICGLSLLSLAGAIGGLSLREL